MSNTPSDAAKAKAEADAAKAKAKAEADAAKAKAKAEAEAAKAEAKSNTSNADPKAFRRSIAAVVPGSRPFGSMPAAKMRLEEALQKVVSGQEAVASARAILEDLKGEKVTGADTTGAEAILGDELPLFEDLIAEAEEALASLRGED